jgi:prepilin-type N-terminal cleavage/methylation domain-containing protein
MREIKMKLSVTSSSKQAFTLIELMAVIAIIGILITLISPAISKAQFQAKLTKEATKARAIVEAIMAKESASRFSTGWPKSTGKKVYATSAEFFDELVQQGFLDVDYAFFAGPGMTPARDQAEFLEHPERHNLWCVVMDIDDTTPGNTPVVYTRNLDINSFTFDESHPLGSKGFAFATKNGEAVTVNEAEIKDQETFGAIFNFKGKSNVIALLPSYASDARETRVVAERVVTNLHTRHVIQTNTIVDVVNVREKADTDDAKSINLWMIGFLALALLLVGAGIGIKLGK